MNTNLLGRALTLALTLFAALFITHSANAGPVPMERTVMAEPFDFSGFYIGGSIGGLWTDYHFSDYDVDVDLEGQYFELIPNRSPLFPDQKGFFNVPIATFSSSAHGPGSDDSFMGGGQAGYQMQFGHFVVGVEGDFNRAATNASTSFEETQSFIQASEGDGNVPQGLFGADLHSTTDFESFRKAETNWTASARARLGYAKGPVMLYGTGGVAFAQVKVFAQDTARTNFFVNTTSLPPGPSTPSGIPVTITEDLGTVSNTNTDSDSDTLIGWTAGGGVEYALNDTVTIGLEYRHSDYGGETFHFNHGSASPFPTTTGSGSSSDEGFVFPGNMHVDMESDQVTFRVNILLNRFFGR